MSILTYMLVMFPESLVTEFVWWVAWESVFCLIITFWVYQGPWQGQGHSALLTSSCSAHWCSLKLIWFLSCLSSCCLLYWFWEDCWDICNGGKRQTLCDSFLESFIIVLTGSLLNSSQSALKSKLEWFK